MVPERPGDHFDHVKTPNGAVSTRFSQVFMFFAYFSACGRWAAAAVAAGGRANSNPTGVNPHTQNRYPALRGATGLVF